MNRIKILAVFILLFSLLFGQRVEVSVDKTSCSRQETILLTFVFENFNDAPNSVNFDLMTDFTVIGGPSTSRRTSWINGKMSSMVTLTYEIRPNDRGRLKIPSFRFKTGKNYNETEEIKIQVTKSGDQISKSSGGDIPDIFIETVIPRDSYYQGETFTVYYRLYSSVDVLQYQMQNINSVEGFILDSYKVHEKHRTRVVLKTLNGVKYKVYDAASITLTSTKIGDKKLPPIELAVSIPKAGRYDPFWGTPKITKKLFTDSKTIHIQNLPPGGGPDFSGAVGDFFLAVSLDSSRVEVNQPVSMKIEVTGHGNMKHFTFPDLKFENNLEVFEPKTKNTVSLGSQDYSGKKIWEYIIIPGLSGRYILNDIHFTFFSTSSESYKTLTAEGPVLDVEGEKSQNDRIIPDKDIRYINVRENSLYKAEYHAVTDIRNYKFFFLALILAAVYLLVGIYSRYLKVNINAIRKRHAFINSIQSLKKINPAMHPSEILKIIEESFNNYTKDKFNRSALSYRQEDCSINDIFMTIETYKYAPGILSYEQLMNLKKDVLDIIDKMERTS